MKQAFDLLWSMNSGGADVTHTASGVQEAGPEPHTVSRRGKKWDQLVVFMLH